MLPHMIKSRYKGLYDRYNFMTEWYKGIGYLPNEMSHNLSITPIALIWLLIEEKILHNDARFSKVMNSLSIKCYYENASELAREEIQQIRLDDSDQVNKFLDDFVSLKTNYITNDQKEEIYVPNTKFVEAEAVFSIRYSRNREFRIQINTNKENDYVPSISAYTYDASKGIMLSKISPWIRPELEYVHKLSTLEEFFNLIFFKEEKKLIRKSSLDSATKLSYPAKEKYKILTDIYNHWKRYKAKKREEKNRRAFYLFAVPLAIMKLLADERMKNGDPRFINIDTSICYATRGREDWLYSDTHAIYASLDDVSKGIDGCYIHSNDGSTDHNFSKIKIQVLSVHFEVYSEDSSEHTQLSFSIEDDEGDFESYLSAMRIYSDEEMNYRYHNTYFKVDDIEDVASLFNTIFY